MLECARVERGERRVGRVGALLAQVKVKAKFLNPPFIHRFYFIVNQS